MKTSRFVASDIRWLVYLLIVFSLSGCYVPPDGAPLPASVPPTIQPAPVHVVSSLVFARDNSVLISGQIAPVEPGLPFAIGTSAEGRPILAYRFGTGPVFVALIGGIHGGYEPNTVTLAGRFIQHLASSPQLVPPQLSVFIIPAMNPDGYTKKGFKGRVNANQVDLNRNWGCEWVKRPAASYYGQPYNTGTSAFSEPETRAVRNFLLQNDFKAVVFYHSRGAVVFYGACGGGGQSLELAKVVSKATGYALEGSRIHPSDAERLQKLPGEAANYFDVQGLAAIDIELSTRDPDNIDWAKNYQGLLAILDYAVKMYTVPQAFDPSSVPRSQRTRPATSSSRLLIHRVGERTQNVIHGGAVLR